MGPVKQDMSSYSKIHEIQMDSLTCPRMEQTQRNKEVFLGQLVHIDEQMGTDDLELLKFVCRDVIGVSKLESVKSALDIFQLLEKLALIKAGEVDFLIECLGLIHRFDLMRLLGFDNIDGIKEGFSCFDKINLFRKLMLKIAEDLDDTELHKMKFLLSGNVRKKRLQECKTGMDLFVFMEQENLLAHRKLELLVYMLTNIKRTDLVHKIQQFSVPPLQQTVPVRSGANPTREPYMIPVNRSPSAGTLSASNSEGSDVTVRPVQPMQQNNHQGSGLTPSDVQVHDIQTGLNVIGQLNPTVLPPQYRTNSQTILSAAAGGYPYPQGYTTYSDPLQNDAQPLPGSGVPQLHIAQQRGVNQNQRDNTTPATDSSELPVYDMSKKPKGWCVIINNQDFHVIDSDSKELLERSGTDVDAENLKNVFDELGFIVQRRDNLTHTAMREFLIDVAHNVDHTNFDCFVCCILTHGVLNHLYGTDGKLISIKNLTSMFQANQCPSLTGKPKLFFLQACQGQEKMTSGEANRYRDIEIEIDANGDLQTNSNKEMIPNEADFMIGYATVPGYVSFRSTTQGSWYIHNLCELLKTLSHKEDLLSILVHVNNAVCKASASLSDGIFKQTPAPLVTLRKKLYFR